MKKMINCWINSMKSPITLFISSYVKYYESKMNELSSNIDSIKMFMPKQNVNIMLELLSICGMANIIISNIVLIDKYKVKLVTLKKANQEFDNKFDLGYCNSLYIEALQRRIYIYNILHEYYMTIMSYMDTTYYEVPKNEYMFFMCQIIIKMFDKLKSSVTILCNVNITLRDTMIEMFTKMKSELTVS